MYCAICREPLPRADVFLDVLVRPVHYACKARLLDTRALARTVRRDLAAGTRGRAGGLARAAVLSPARRRQIAREAARARWGTR